ncbi:MAG: glycosyltransferase family 2 protein [Planctomycetes bacterium]|nr:glycosyltransferase family 2 protein [Planctomycetota bacterium]
MPPRILTALPVYNEERHLIDVLTEVKKYATDILVVDDGSSDRTPELMAHERRVFLVRHEHNQGYGAALRTAFQYALDGQYDVLVTIDCDGQHEPCLIPQLAAAIHDQQDRPADIVSGSRYLAPIPGDSQPPADRRRINRLITELLKERFGLSLTDSFCGFKAYRVDALARFRITELGYAMPLQLWVQAAALDMKIVEFPVPLIYLDEARSFGGALDQAEARLAYYHEVIDREVASMRLDPGSHGTGPARCPSSDQPATCGSAAP